MFTAYENDERAVTCGTGGMTGDKCCLLNITKQLNELDCTRENDYGYFEGKPCVVLKMNKVYSFQQLIRLAFLFKCASNVALHVEDNVWLRCGWKLIVGPYIRRIV